MSQIKQIFTLFPLFLVVLITNAQTLDQEAIDAFVGRHAMIYGVDSDEIRSILAKAQVREDILGKMDRPAEKKMTWERYRNIFLTKERIDAGVEFWKENEDALVATSLKSGVPVGIICSIIGVETFFGRIKGSYKVLDALYTLSFAYPKRSRYFQSELDEFLVLARKEHFDLYETKGSYAGALGYCQFMPSSYRAYAVSYDEDGNRDIVNSPEDAIASVANYLKVHKWKPGESIATQAIANESANYPLNQSTKPSKPITYYTALGFEPSTSTDPSTKSTLYQMEMESGNYEYWYGFHNFYVITRYNHSPLYALAVYQLAQAIKRKRG